MSTALTPITGDRDADELLSEEPLALLIGMLLDPQVPMEWAFKSPLRLKERLGGGPLDAAAIAAMSPEAVEAVFKEKPALHRFPGSMARRTHDLCRNLVEDYDSDASVVWTGAADAADLWQRPRGPPGFGEDKAQIFLAIMGKCIGVPPGGGEEFAGPVSDDEPRSVADIDSPEAFDRVRAWKKAKKAAGKSKRD